ncbi:hypothetical protein HaLaN_17070, partial [Haematococcus lacustris]
MPAVMWPRRWRSELTSASSIP